MSVLNVLNNTILIPTGGSLTPLPKSTVADDLAKVDFEKIKWKSDNPQTTYIKVNDGASQKIITVQRIGEFGMTRENEQRRAGGNSEYVVNLPGRVTYTDVTFFHLFTRDKFFLDWLTTGALKNGVARADVEIHVTAVDKNNREMVFTLYDAFPTKWEIRQMESNVRDIAIMEEEVTLTYSKIGFALQELSSN